MINFTFLILNYKTVFETNTCVDSIRKLDKKGMIVNILIVDNKSDDGSFEKLKEQYKEDRDIRVIQNEKNAGFSAGNNLGYEYIRANYHPDFIIMINSDIIIRQNDFLQSVSNIYMRTQFSVLGPDVYAYRLHLHQSPIRISKKSKEETQKELRHEKACLQMYIEQKALGKNFIHDSLPDRIIKSGTKWGRWLGIDRLNFKKPPYWREQENVMLHGSAIIFSRKYINKYKVCLYPLPFYYGEEDLLFLKCCRYNDKIIYSPKIKVYHSAGASATKAKGKNNSVDREIFKYRNLVETKELYLQVLKDKEYFEPSLQEKENIMNEKIN